MPGSDPQYDAFLSYCRVDKRLAEHLVDLLKARDKSVWWDVNLPIDTPGWRNDVAAAILASESLVVLVTDNSISRPEVSREVQFACENAKKVVPIVVGEVAYQADCAGLWLLLCTYNQIRASQIDKSVADHCCTALVARFELPQRESGVPHHLEALQLEEEDVPRFGPSQSPVAQACEQSYLRQMRGNDWEQAGALLEDMKRRRVWPEGFERVAQCYECFRFYDSLVRTCRTWVDVAQKIRERPGGLAAGEAGPCGKCPLVPQRLRRAWQSVLEESCRKVFNCLCFGPQDNSYRYALKHFEFLRSQWKEPFAAILPAQVLAAQQDVYGWAEQSLQACDPDFEEPLAQCRRLLKGRWPSLPGEPGALEASWARCRSGVEAARDFVRFLRSNVPGSGATSPLVDLARRVELAVSDAEVLAEMPDFADVRGRVDAWRRALEGLADPEGGVSAGLVQDLEEVGKTFPAARAQADRFGEWLQWQVEHGSSPVDFADAQFIEIERTRIAEGERRLTALLREVAEPYERHLQQRLAEADPVCLRGRQWRQHLEGQRRELAQSRAILDVFRLLRSDRPREAQDRVNSSRDLLDSYESTLTQNGKKYADDVHDSGPSGLDSHESTLAQNGKKYADDLHGSGSSGLDSHESTLAQNGKKYADDLDGSGSSGLGPLGGDWDDLCQRCGRLGDSVPSLLEAASARGDRPAISDESLLSIDADRLDGAQEQIDAIRSILRRVRYRGTPCDLAVIPALVRLPALLSVVKEIRPLWDDVLAKLSDRDFDGAWKAAESLARRLPAAQDMANTVQQIRAAEDEHRAGIEEHVGAGRWDAAVAGLRSLQQQYSKLTDSLGEGFGQRSLGGALANYGAAAQRQADQCLEASRDEQKLAQALELLDQEKTPEAMALLCEMGSASPAVTPWKRFANALQALLAELEGIEA